MENIIAWWVMLILVGAVNSGTTGQNQMNQAEEKNIVKQKKERKKKNAVRVDRTPASAPHSNPS